MDEDIKDLLTTTNDLMEYKIGVKKAGAKYLQRFGVPGNYTYIYPSAQLKKVSRKARASYTRFLRRSRGFFKKFGISYDVKSINIRPTSWHSALVKAKSHDGDVSSFKVNLKKHKLYSYRSRRMSGGASTKLSRAKKAGILRYR